MAHGELGVEEVKYSCSLFLKDLPSFSKMVGFCFILVILYHAGSCIIPPDSVLLFDVEFIGKA